MELYYDEPWCKIYYLNDLDCVYLDWHGFAEDDQFQEACYASLDLLKEKKLSKMIADNTDARVVSIANQDWLNEVWFPKAYKEGYRASAIVVSKDLFNEVAVKKIVSEMDGGLFTVHFFQNLEAAKDWLREITDEI